MKLVFLDGPLEGEIERDIPTEIGKIWTIAMGAVRSGHPLSRHAEYWNDQGGGASAHYQTLKYCPGLRPEDGKLYLQSISMEFGNVVRAYKPKETENDGT